MKTSFFNVVVVIFKLVVELQAAPSFESGTWYARGGGLQIPIVMTIP